MLTVPIAKGGTGSLGTRDLVVNYYIGGQAGPVREDMPITNANFWLSLP